MPRHPERGDISWPQAILGQGERVGVRVFCILALALLFAACGREKEDVRALPSGGESAVGDMKPAKPVCNLIEPPPPPPEMILTNESQFQLTELRLHSTANYRPTPNILTEPFEIGRSLKRTWKDSMYVTIIREKVQYGARVAMTTPQPIGDKPYATAHQLRIFDEAFRGIQLTEFPRALGPGDTGLPQFEGLGTIQAPPECPPFDELYVGAEIVLTWNPASDEVSPSIAHRFEICQSLEKGACATNFVPTYTSAPGQQVFKLTPKSPGEYYFTVRARDETGNIETNAIEKSIRIKPSPNTPDTTPPTFKGIQEVEASSSTEAVLIWEAATDDRTGASGIWYTYCVSKTEGECVTNFKSAGSTYGTTATAKNLGPGGKHYFVVRASDQAGNFDANQEMSVILPEPPVTPQPPTPEPPPTQPLPSDPPPSTTQPPPVASTSDSQAPQFAGLQSIETAAGGDVILRWLSASDNLTAPESIVYEICQSTRTGDCVTDFWATYETAPGATSYTLMKFNAHTQYYFVVRARDASGRRDSNTVELVLNP